MTRAEYKRRTEAALEAIRAGEPARAIVLYVCLLLSAATRVVVYAGAAFGIVETIGWSVWWGIPIAVGIANTFGEVWAWMRRRRTVEMLEDAAGIRVTAPESTNGGGVVGG